MHRLIRLPIVASVLIIFCALAAATGASAKTQYPTHYTRGFSMVIAPGESFADAARQAAQGPDGGRVANTISAMIKRVETGQAIYIPQGTRGRVVNVLATVPELRAALAVTRSVKTRQSGVEAAATVLQLAPMTWATRGTACYSTTYEGETWYTAWCNLNLELDGAYCDPGCETVDRLEAVLKTNPGALTSRTSYTIKNVVTTGFSSTFTDVYLTWNTLCYRTQNECGHGETGHISPPSGSGSMSPTSDVPLYGDTISHAYFLWALFIPNGGKYSDHAATGKATCKPASSGSNACLYPSLLDHHSLR